MREKIAHQIIILLNALDDHVSDKKAMAEDWKKGLDQILSLKDIAIIDKDQSLPDGDNSTPMDDFQMLHYAAQKQLRNEENFRRILPKMAKQEFTEREVKAALNELVELGELKIITVDGEIKYVTPDFKD